MIHILIPTSIYTRIYRTASAIVVGERAFNFCCVRCITENRVVMHRWSYVQVEKSACIDCVDLVACIHLCARSVIIR